MVINRPEPYSHLEDTNFPFQRRRKSDTPGGCFVALPGTLLLIAICSYIILVVIQ